MDKKFGKRESFVCDSIEPAGLFARFGECDSVWAAGFIGKCGHGIGTMPGICFNERSLSAEWFAAHQIGRKHHRI